MAAGMVSAPFPMAAPTLDAPVDVPLADATFSGSTSEPAAAGIIGKADRSGAGSDKQTVLDQVRKSVLEDVDAKLTDKMKDLWSRGNKMLKQIDQENAQHTAKFMEELAERREKQEALKAEQEHLRTLLAGMVQQFSMLGSLYGGPMSPVVPSPVLSASNPPGLGGFAAGGAESSAASVAGSPSATSGLEDSPVVPGYAGSFPPLPTMPDFPFPPAAAVTPSNATPLSLVEALCGDVAASPVPVSLMGSLAQGLSPDAAAPTVFSFTLRKAEGTDLGINVSHHELDKVLWVEGIRPEGAIEAWNRQCISNAAAEKAVVPGDRIVSVNGVINQPLKMLEECRDKQLLKFTIERGGVVTRPPMSAAATTPKAATTLRADACEFVPAGMSPEPPTPEAETEQ